MYYILCGFERERERQIAHTHIQCKDLEIVRMDQRSHNREIIDFKLTDNQTKLVWMHDEITNLKMKNFSIKVAIFKNSKVLESSIEVT